MPKSNCKVFGRGHPGCAATIRPESGVVKFFEVAIPQYSGISGTGWNPAESWYAPSHPNARSIAATIADRGSIQLLLSNKDAFVQLESTAANYAKDLKLGHGGTNLLLLEPDCRVF